MVEYYFPLFALENMCPGVETKTGIAAENVKVKVVFENYSELHWTCASMAESIDLFLVYQFTFPSSQFNLHTYVPVQKRYEYTFESSEPI